MQIRRYRLNRKDGVIYLDLGDGMLEPVRELKTIILYSSRPFRMRLFNREHIEWWVQLCFINSDGDWCYCLLNDGVTGALTTWADYLKVLRSHRQSVHSVITEIRLVRDEKVDYWDYDFEGTAGQPGMEEEVKQLISESPYPVFDEQINIPF